MPTELLVVVLISAVLLAAAFQWRWNVALRDQLIATGAAAADRHYVESSLGQLRSARSDLAHRIDELERASRQARLLHQDLQEQVNAQTTSSEAARERTEDVLAHLDQQMNDVTDRLNAFLAACDSLIRAEIAAQVGELQVPVIIADEAAQQGDAAP